MTGLKIVLGTVQFGVDYGINNSAGKPSVQNVFDIIDHAYESGISELDTADAYGNAQEVLKDYLSQSKNNVVIMSKFTRTPNVSFTESFNRSLERLGVNKLEGYYFHRFKDFLEFNEFEHVKSLKSQGKMKILAVSLYDLEELKVAAKHPEVDLIQLPFNVFDRSEEKIKWLKIAKENNKLIYVRSVFLQGLFFMDVERLPAKLQAMKNNLLQLKKLAAEESLSIEELCLNYVYHQNYIDKMIIGVDSVDQLEKNIKSIQGSFSKALESSIEAIKIDRPELTNPSSWST